MLAETGVTAHHMEVSFPSVTFANHYTLVTGLYPESHGIVANTFFDPDSNSTFHYTNVSDNRNSYWWQGAEPLWTSVVKQGHTSATYYWPGSEAENHVLFADDWA
jgi:predicted AlkP superfamily pyrophosphatase or phosphodiesterase